MKHHNLIVALLVFLVAWWGVWPAYNYTRGTADNVTVSIVAEPFLGADALVYRWTGNLVRSCPVDVRRKITDSEGVVTNLVAVSFDPVPKSSLGKQSYEIIIPVPVRISEGPAIYQAVEVPQCSWLQRLFPFEVPYPPVNFTVTR